jgi:anti-sigma regulatory factor (Ser/Thr protein kinase)
MAEAHWRIDPSSPGSLVQLRRWASSWMETHSVRGVKHDEVVLALNELVTNSIQHTSGPVEVDLAWERDRVLRATVSDGSTAEPSWPPFERRAESGRGLLVLDRLATRWGVIPRPARGKTVWFEFVPTRPIPQANG